MVVCGNLLLKLVKLFVKDMYLLIKEKNKNFYHRFKIDEVRESMDANKYFELVKDHYKKELDLDLDLLGIFNTKQEALKMLHELDPGYQAPINHKDNNGVYHSKKNKQLAGGSHHSSIRVPSLKRSKRTWKKFYELFPSLKGEESLKTTTYYRIGGGHANKRIKLKKV